MDEDDAAIFTAIRDELRDMNRTLRELVEAIHTAAVAVTDFRKQQGDTQ